MSVSKRSHLLHVVVVSSRAEKPDALVRSVQPNVVAVRYDYDTATPNSLLQLVHEALNGRRAPAVGLVLHGVGGHVLICGRCDSTLTAQSAVREPYREFFLNLCKYHMDTRSAELRLDLLGCAISEKDSKQLQQAISNVLPAKAAVTVSPDCFGVALSNDDHGSIGALYFQVDLLSASSRNRSKLQQSTANYTRLRMVGKGASGAAVLYSRNDDDSLVILKEIDMHALNSHQRQMALNEVTILSKLQHPNIIAYFDSFEEDGILMIEMEYAEGGALSQLLAKRKKHLPEKDVLIMFEQMVQAVKYLHDNNVLHRDLKTANVFLTKDCIAKVGDFGISKVMGTYTKRHGATTVVGTPYYLSPELCENRAYNEKSDIWALGCILYEMASLQKAFEATNFPAIVHKIMTASYEQMRGNYTRELKTLVRDLLQKDPTLMSRYNAPHADEPHAATQASGGGEARTVRSILYALDPGQHQLFAVDGLPSRLTVKQVAVSGTHQVVISTEKLVFAWGDNSWGQLGLGDDNYRSLPTLVDSLNGKSIVRAAVGQGFSLFCADNGILMTCGDWQFNGHDVENENLTRPKLIDKLLSVDVLSVACGPQHAVVAGDGGKVFAWGWGAGGRLGTGNERNQLSPVRLNLPDGATVRAVRCGLDGTVFLTHAGALLATGSNNANKLNLNQRQGFFSHIKMAKAEVDVALVPTPTQSFQSRVVDVSLGSDHGAVLLESGQVHTFGGNAQGQLGRGSCERVGGAVIVKTLANKAVIMVQCGDGFTLAATYDSELYFWGSRRNASSALSARLVSGEVRSTRLNDTLQSVAAASYGKPTALVHPFGAKSEPDGAIDKGRMSAESDLLALSLSSKSTLSEATEVDVGRESPAFALPARILRLDSTSGSAALQTYISLGALICYQSIIYLVVETTAPLPKHARVVSGANSKGKAATRASAPLTRTSEHNLGASSRLPETTTPTWIRDELEQADVLPMSASANGRAHRQPRKKRSKIPRKKSRQNRRRQSSTSSSQSEQPAPVAAAVAVQRKNSEAVFERLMCEKLQTENRLRELEAQYGQGARVKGSEAKLLSEIDELKQALRQQHDQLQLNSSQFEKLKMEMTLLQSKGGRDEAAPPVNKSAACVIL